VDEKNKNLDYLSDLEDEIIYAFKNINFTDDKTKNVNNFNNNIFNYSNKYINSNFINSNCINSNANSTISNSQNNDKIKNNLVKNNFDKTKDNLYINAIRDKSSNYNYYRKNYIPKSNKDQDRLKDQIPLFKNFNPSYIKRANIDKKIIRKFRNFLKSQNNNNNNNFNSHWNLFIQGKLLPPFKIFDDILKKEIQFKSYNTNYLIYIFQLENAYNLYNQFLKKEAQKVLDNLIRDYNLEKKDDIENLKFYF